MAERDIFLDLALTPDRNVAQALDSLACLALLAAAFEVSLQAPWPAVTALALTILSVAWAYLLRYRQVHSNVLSANRARNATYLVTEERLMILRTELVMNVFQAVASLPRKPMDGRELVRELNRVLPQRDLKLAMPTLLITLADETSANRSSDAAPSASDPSS